MKKTSSVLFCVLILLSFTACDNVKNSLNQDNVSSLKQQEQIYFNLGETAELQNLRFTAVKYDETNGDEYRKPKDNNVFVGIEFVVENISKDEQFVYSDEMFECYIDDFKSEESDDARYALGGEALVETIATGKKIRGCYAVEAPKDWSVIEIHISNFGYDSEQEKLIFKIEK